MTLPRPPDLPIPEDDWSQLSPEAQTIIVTLWQQLRAIEERLAAIEQRWPPPPAAGQGAPPAERHEAISRPAGSFAPSRVMPAGAIWRGRQVIESAWRDPLPALLWSLVATLVVISVVPAVLGWQQIARYAALPLLEATVEREVLLQDPNVRPVSGGQGVAVAASGAIFLADLNPRRFLVFPDGTTASGRIAGTEQGPEALREPFDVAIGPDGVVYLLDRATGNVNLFSPDGVFRRALKLAAPGARALTIDAAGRILIGDSGPQFVRRFRSDGQPDLGWGDGTAPGATRVGEVLGLAVTGDTTYATVPGAIIQLDAHGRLTARVPLLGNAGPLAVAPSGRLFMTDLAANRVWIFGPDGQAIGRLVGPGGDERQFSQPRGLTVTADSRLYVVNENRVTVFRLGESDHAR